ncbi:hypothetical protein OG897_32445 [Streptomyces sp. NBC_00237]|uniref:hypothetical protein n=1 Tax=Streptomyces sp. NBC_00237 TaxID=2975687 RepID=UPI00224CFCA0|nr:hypothetical protein [Streptomyces sp. NBC_00237]MCX5206109.1 hypothetical protein [Streptomyces sp. NBC_00237]
MEAKLTSDENLMDRVADRLFALMLSLPEGHHHVVVSTDGRSPAFMCVYTDATMILDDPNSIPDVMAVLASALENRSGGLVTRTFSADGAETVRGWAVTADLVPLTVAQVFAAYCTDAKTGEPVPPEFGVTYEAGFAVPEHP